MELRSIIKEKKNKKADVQSIMFVTVILVVSGIIIFVFSHLFYEIYNEMNETLGDAGIKRSATLNETLEDVISAEKSAWDYGFLAIAFGYIIAIAIFGWSTRISPFFFWIAVIMILLGFFMGVIMSNLWQEMVAQPVFTDTVARFPITNSILGTYYPTFMIFFFLTGLVLLFGKPVGGGER